MAQVLLGQMLRTATTSEPLGTTSGKLNVRASEIDSALTTLNAKDFATQTTAAAILAKLSADPATQTTLAALLAKVSGDQATQTTLAAVLAKLSADPATETSLAALKALFDTGTAGVALTGSIPLLASGSSQVVAASSSLVMLARTEIADYREMRVGVRWLTTVPTSWSVRVVNSIADEATGLWAEDLSMTTGSVSTDQFVGTVTVRGPWVQINVLNNDGSDRTVSRFSVLGVVN